MNFSIFNLFKVGFGPSSSHTLAPMLACKEFLEQLIENAQLHQVSHISIELFGSLAERGKKHGSDKACVLGLIGENPQSIDLTSISSLLNKLKRKNELPLNNERYIHFNWEKSFKFNKNKESNKNKNGITITAKGKKEEILFRRTFYCLSNGSFIQKGKKEPDNFQLPFPYSNAKELLDLCEYEDISIADIVFANELAYARNTTPEIKMENIKEKIDQIWLSMLASINKGISQEGVLPGPLSQPRRAKILKESIEKRTSEGLPIESDDWVNLYAIAVSEENAAGCRIVSAPTNGAAGVIPAVLAYYDKFVSPNNVERIRIFLATAAGIASIYKNNSALFESKLGCQGEIGVASSLAAAGLAAAKKGTAKQIEHAAEIAMEHNLGLTCDPIDGLVQNPCIERNTMGAVKAINAARLSLRSPEIKNKSLDNIISTMKEIGEAMEDKMKTSVDEGQVNKISVNVIEC